MVRGLRLVAGVAAASAALGSAFVPGGQVPAVHGRSTSFGAAVAKNSVSAAKPWWRFWSQAESGEGGLDITSSPSFLKRKIEILKEELTSVNAETEEAEANAAKEFEEWGPQIERLKNEFSFLQQRAAKDSRQANVNARVNVLRDLLPVIDNFERASGAMAAETEKEKEIIALYTDVNDKIQGVLKEFEVETIKTVGEPFDYNFHEAIQQVPSDEFDEEIVCQEYQKGYKIDDKLIRAAIVAVSTG